MFGKLAKKWFILLQVIAASFAALPPHWSACDVTCGGGKQIRMYKGRVISKSCNQRICPGLFGWPRIHFHGEAVVNTATTNNNRCYYNNKFFPPYSPQNYLNNEPEVAHRGALPQNKLRHFSLNPLGDDHFYFTTTRITAVCDNGSCGDKQLIHAKIKNLHHARMLDIDVDYQSTPEIFGLTIHVAGAFEANSTITQAYDYGVRTNKFGGDTAKSVKFKAHLTVIRWFDPYYKKKFKNATKLAMTLLMDLYTFQSRMVRITGTIGETFHNDPQNGHAGRIMSGYKDGEFLVSIPFHLHLEYYKITLDLTKAILSDSHGNFFSKAIKQHYKTLGLGIELPAYFLKIIHLFQSKFKTQFRVTSNWFANYHRQVSLPELNIAFNRLTEAAHPQEPSRITTWRKTLFLIFFKKIPVQVLKCQSKKSSSLFLLFTKTSSFSSIFKNNKWYENYGGFYDVNLKYLGKNLLSLVEESKMAFLNYSSINVAYTTVYRGKRVHAIASKTCNVIAIENSFGLNVQSLYGVRNRLTKGSTWPMKWIVTKYGKILPKRTEISVFPLDKMVGIDSCEPMQKCGKYLSHPTNILEFSKPRKTKKDGTVKTFIKVTKSPGNPRKCNIDGQIYQAVVKMNYTLSKADQIYFMTHQGSSHLVVFDAGTLEGKDEKYRHTLLKKHHGNEQYFSSQILFLVFDNLPGDVMRKTCPSWERDIRPIFQFYYNMFPVMSTSGIIDLRNKKSLRENLRMLNMSMFGLPWEHPNFMPTSRDLSPDKTEIVRRWIECEAAGIPETRSGEERLILFDSVIQVCGNSISWNKNIQHLQNLVQSAIMIEWYTIPPYLTAWFSIREGRSKRAADILKSIYTEEMLHMTLAANVLTAIGGHPNFTDSMHLPRYPTYLPSHDVLQIRPGLLLTLEPFSKSLIRDVFTKLEEPAPIEVQWVILEIGYLLRSVNNLEAKNGTRIEGNHAWDRPIQFLHQSPSKYFHKILSAEMHATSNSLFWSQLFQYSTNRLKETPELNNCNSIGGYYAHIMLKLLQSEACHRLAPTSSSSLFSGDPSHQIGSDQWYARAGVSSGKVFKVVGITTAIAALLTIVYEGEGSSPCGVHVREILSTERHFTPERDHSQSFLEKSHYIKFKELAAGRELVKVNSRKPEWSDVDCFGIPKDVCNCSEDNSINCCQYCFIGKDVSVPMKSIWPMMTSPNDKIYLKHTRAHLLNSVFNEIYSNLMRCLETAFNGSPFKMAECTTTMKELLVYGKKITQTSIYEVSGTRNATAKPVIKAHKNFTGPNASPTWAYHSYPEQPTAVPISRF